jgi:hypothetical protein
MIHETWMARLDNVAVFLGGKYGVMPICAVYLHP